MSNDDWTPGTIIEGVDYSRTTTADWTALAASLKAAGKHFAGRYAVNDKSPQGRGITAGEYQALMAGGIDVFLYWEATEAWMLGGWDAGVRAAENAMANIRGAGMPEEMPVYYSHDIEPAAIHFAEVNDCLRGAASVVGIERVGLYAGWLAIAQVAMIGTARYLCQTYAWENGRGLHPAACLYQYDNYGNEISGTDVDLVRAVKPFFGQASSFLEPVEPEPIYPSDPIAAPDELRAQGYILTINTPNRFTCLQGGRFKTAPSRDAPDVKKPPYKAGKPYTFDFRATVEGEDWYVSKRGSWAVARNFEVVP